MVTTEKPVDLHKIKAASTEDLSLGAEYGHHAPAHRQAVLDELHKRVQAEFEQVLTDDPEYRMTRDDVRPLSTDALGNILLDMKLDVCPLIPWVQAVIRDELHGRAAADNAEDDHMHQVYRRTDSAQLHSWIEGPALLLIPMSEWTRERRIRQMRAELRRREMLSRPLSREAMDLLKSAQVERLHEPGNTIMHLVDTGGVLTDHVAELVVRALVVRHTDGRFKLTMTGYSLRLRLV